MIIPNISENKSYVPNHQPVYDGFLYGFHEKMGIPIFFGGGSVKAKERVLKVMEIQDTTSMDLDPRDPWAWWSAASGNLAAGKPWKNHRKTIGKMGKS